MSPEDKNRVREYLRCLADKARTKSIQTISISLGDIDSALGIDNPHILLAELLPGSETLRNCGLSLHEGPVALGPKFDWADTRFTFKVVYRS